MFSRNRQGHGPSLQGHRNKVCAEPKGGAQIGVNFEPTHWLSDKKSGGPNLAGNYQRVPSSAATSQCWQQSSHWQQHTVRVGECVCVCLCFRKRFVQPSLVKDCTQSNTYAREETGLKDRVKTRVREYSKRSLCFQTFVSVYMSCYVHGAPSPLHAPVQAQWPLRSGSRLRRSGVGTAWDKRAALFHSLPPSIHVPFDVLWLICLLLALPSSTERWVSHFWSAGPAPSTTTDVRPYLFILPTVIVFNRC